MVAQRTTNRRLSTLIYLALLLLSGCEQQQYTLVELHHIPAADIESILQQQLGDDIKYDITGQSIIFYSDREPIKNTIALLQALDKGQSLYEIEFAWANKRRYSTIKLPKPIYVKQDRDNLVQLFDHKWQIKVEPIDQQRVLCEIALINKRRLESVQQFVLEVGTPKQIEHAKLPRGLTLSIQKI